MIELSKMGLGRVLMVFSIYLVKTWITLERSNFRKIITDRISANNELPEKHAL